MMGYREWGQQIASSGQQLQCLLQNSVLSEAGHNGPVVLPKVRHCPHNIHFRVPLQDGRDFVGPLCSSFSSSAPNCFFLLLSTDGNLIYIFPTEPPLSPSHSRNPTHKIVILRLETLKYEMGIIISYSLFLNTHCTEFLGLCGVISIISLSFKPHHLISYNLCMYCRWRNHDREKL